MIAASRKRRDLPSLDEALNLHLKLARRDRLETRLQNGAIAALVGSVGGLLFAPSVTLHAALAVTGFLIGFLLPARGSLGRAFDSIREQAGLAYETALELRASPAAGDPYDFRGRVDERARISVRDVRPPARPAWWVPLVAVAFSLLLIPAFGTPRSAGDGGGLAADGGAPGPAAIETPATLVEQEEAQLPDQGVGRVEQPDVADPTGPGDGPDAASVPPSAAGEAAPLSRFLDSLRERPSDAGGGGQGGEQAQPEEPAGEQAGSQRGGGEGDPQRVELGDEQGEPGEGRAANLGGEEGEGDGSDQGSSGDAGSDAGGEEEGGADQMQAGDSQNPFQQADGEGPDPLGGEQPGDMQSDLGQTGPEGGEDGETGSADMVAGSEAGGEQAAGAAGLGADASPELLTGVLREGPESSAGAVLLPGQDEVELPPGTTFTSYATAAEEALTEGDLPLEYQDIIRRYFQ